MIVGGVLKTIIYLGKMNLSHLLLIAPVRQVPSGYWHYCHDNYLTDSARKLHGWPCTFSSISLFSRLLRSQAYLWVYMNNNEWVMQILIKNPLIEFVIIICYYYCFMLYIHMHTVVFHENT